MSKLFCLYMLACFAAFAQRAPLDEAWDLAANGHREQAMQVLYGLVEKNASDADARLLLGSLLMEQGTAAEAIRFLTEAVQLRPQSADAQNALCEAYLNFSKPKAARSSCEKAVASKPDFSVARVNLGLALLETADYGGAAKQLDQALKDLKDNSDAGYAHYLRAKVYSAQARPQEAASQLEQAVSVRPEYAEAWSELGQARKVLLDDAGALAAEKRAVELNPKDAIAQCRLGAEYLRQSQPGLAIEHLEEAYRLNPQDQSTLNSLQAALRQNGKPEEANQIRAQLGLLLRERDRANQDSLKAVKLNNDGAALEKTGNFRDAVEKYRHALELYPSHNGIRVNLGVALLRLGDWAEGLELLHRALEGDPGNATIRAALEDALKQAPAEKRPEWARERR